MISTPSSIKAVTWPLSSISAIVIWVDDYSPWLTHLISVPRPGGSITAPSSITLLNILDIYPMTSSDPCRFSIAVSALRSVDIRSRYTPGRDCVRAAGYTTTVCPIPNSVANVMAKETNPITCEAKARLIFEEGCGSLLSLVDGRINFVTSLAQW